MHADVGNVAGHPFDGAGTPEVQKFFLAGGVELQKCRSILEALGPFRPATGGVFPVGREDGSSSRPVPTLFKTVDLISRKLEQPFQSRKQRTHREL